MTAKQLKNSILLMAVQGKLVPQDPADEPASLLLERIKAEKEQLIKSGKIKKSKPLPPITDDEIPFDIPDDWEWVRLGNIVEIKGGKRVSNGYNLLTTPTEHIYIRVSDMKNGTIDDSDLRYIDNEMFQKIKQYIITKDDLYMTIVGATIGKCGYVPEKFDNMNLTENAARIILYKINKLFLLTILDSRFCQEQFINKTNQVGVQKMALNRLATTLIPLPPLAEQHRIVAKKEELLPLVEEYGEKHDTLEALNKAFPIDLKKSILQSAVQGKLVEQDADDESASLLLERIRAEKEKLIKEGKIKRGKSLPAITEEEVPFELPDGWVWERIGNISEFVSKGTTPRGGNVAYKDKDIGFLRVENIGKNGELLLNNLKYIDEEIHLSFLKRSILKENDLLVSIAGALGRTAIIPKSALPLNANQAVSFIRWFNTDLLYIKYIELAMNCYEIQKLLLAQTKVTAIPNLTLEIIANCLIPIPPIREQERIVARVEELLGVVGALK